MADPKRLTFNYRNHRGETGRRLVSAPKLEYRVSDHHKEPNPHWYLVAYDIDKDAIRDFRVDHILSVIREVP